ncbi:hypothetical protein VCR26J2_380108 [Vibrio coralliirubri]|nr:hypothetical protein VCR26J2_380108 [Vibrio coralliirubri]
MDGSSTPQKASSSHQSITNKNKHPDSTFYKDEPTFKHTNYIVKFLITMTPAHQTFGKGGNSLSYRPFCIYNH